MYEQTEIMTLYIYIAQSLDGYIAGPNGDLDWLNNIPNPDNNDFGFAEFMKQIDAVVMGRNTFEKVQTFGIWPYSKPVYVASGSLKSLPSEYSGKAQIINLSPSEIVEKLEKEGLSNIYIDGGALIQSFLTKDLIDELIITTVPILLGSGISLFGKLETSVELKFRQSEILINSLVKSYYTREKA